jgi:hypothetical protein
MFELRSVHCERCNGRALEGLVRSFTTPTTYLKDGIDKLHELDIIDDRLHKWGKAVHLERNEGAHASGRSYNEQDASDILEFSRAIIEYVFDISRRFENSRLGGLNENHDHKSRLLRDNSRHRRCLPVKFLSGLAAVLIVFFLLPWSVQRLIAICLIVYLVMNGLADMISDRIRK